MNSKPLTVMRLCLANLTTAWAIVLAIFATVTIPSVIQIVQAGPNEYFERSYLLSSGNAWYPLLIIVPVIVATRHLTKVMHLNAAKETFLAGAVLVYAVLAACVSGANQVFHYSLDQSWSQTFQVVNLAEVFGWAGNGPLVSFVQQFAFLILVAVGVHCLASIQRSWVGWAVDLLLIVLVGASLGVEPLVSFRLLVADLLVLHSSAIVQVGSCLVLATGLYRMSLTVLRRTEL